MDQSRHFWSHRSPKACRNRGSHERADQKPRYLHTANEEDDWETDPDYVNDANRQREEREVSTASIISDLSRSIRDCSFRRSAPHNKKQYADHQSSHRDSSLTPAKEPEGQRTLLCPRVHSSPSLGIERSSVFNRNAAETLDTFFTEKLKAWASDATQLSDSYENVESPQEPPGHSRGRRRTEKAPKGPERTSRRQNPEWPAPTRGMVVQGTCSSWNNYEPGIYYGQGLRQDPLSKGVVLGGLQERQEATAVSSSARILPQCRISHVQSCGACQAFNRELPAGKEAFDEECWPPWHKEDRDRRRARPGKGRPGSSSQRRLCKVQQWLEQSPAAEHPKAEEPAGMVAASPETTCESMERKAGGPLGRAQDAGDCWSLENPAEARHRGKAHKARNPGHQQAPRGIGGAERVRREL